eukprot:gnl/MRDRNA2_/MRDRNA2_82530_c0_seq1.p1 gnl/MRDRNA2_/MRDRNA2_82530_c0~~gnl/MRDRNA2_/MRDRNA2_82530_c0_seq1.p1  ORF type:complete len:114 (+),score=21.09 gnl/MRDRNA2_/MRDRNA2_82530_c0_seq1:98-439(+)
MLSSARLMITTLLVWNMGTALAHNHSNSTEAHNETNATHTPASNATDHAHEGDDHSGHDHDEETPAPAPAPVPAPAPAPAPTTTQAAASADFAASKDVAFVPALAVLIATLRA